MRKCLGSIGRRVGRIYERILSVAVELSLSGRLKANVLGGFIVSEPSEEGSRILPIRSTEHKAEGQLYKKIHIKIRTKRL